MSEAERAGLIIAGGRSTRFGDADKAVAQLAGVPMIRRVADRLRDPVDTLVINCRHDQVEEIESSLEGYALPVHFRLDETPDQGPLAGIARGLDGIEADVTFVAACDMPGIQPAVVEHLFDLIEGVDAVVPRTNGEWLQPMHAVYRTEPMRVATRKALDEGDRRIVHALDRLSVQELPEEELTRIGSLKTLENLNTFEEFKEAERRFQETSESRSRG